MTTSASHRGHARFWASFTTVVHEKVRSGGKRGTRVVCAPKRNPSYGVPRSGTLSVHKAPWLRGRESRRDGLAAEREGRTSCRRRGRVHHRGQLAASGARLRRVHELRAHGGRE